MGRRVKDEGGSEGRPVTGRTGVEPMATSLHAKAGRLPSGVSGRKPSVNRRSKQSRTVGEVAMTSAGAACATAVNSVAGPVAVTLRLTPRPMGQPRSGRKRCLMLELHASKWRPFSSEGRGCWQQHLLTRLSQGRDYCHGMDHILTYPPKEQELVEQSPSWRPK